MKMFCFSCIQPFWTRVYLQVGEDWGGNEIITTEVRHTNFVMWRESKNPQIKEKNTLDPKKCWRELC